MTISSSTRKAGPFTGNGTATTFPFTFKVFQASDLLVVRLNTSTFVESTLVLNTDYTVSLNQNQNTNPGGSIVLGSVLATGFTLTATSDIQNLQPTDLTNQGGFYPTVINDALDRATIQIQQIQEEVDRSLKYPISDPVTGAVLPPVGARASKVLAFDALTGEPIAGPSIGDVATMVGNLADIHTVASDIANVNIVAADITTIDAVAANKANIDAVAGDLTNINAVEADLANIDIAAENVADINNFADVYQGAKATDPTLRNNGSALHAGDMYFNTTVNEIRAYSGTVWVAGTAGAMAVQRFDGTGSATAFTLATAPAGENNTQVYINGVYQQKDSYAVSGVTLTFDSAPPAGTGNIEVVTISTLALGATDAALVSTTAGTGGLWSTVQGFINRIVSSIGSSLVGFIQAGTGAIARTSQDKMRENVSIKDFGAVGDGVTDDTAAFNLAIAYANGRGGIDAANITGTTIFMPDGRYKIGTLNAITKSGCNFVGASENGTVLLLTSGTTTFTFGDGVNTCVGGGVSRCKLEYLSAPSGTNIVFKLSYAFRLVFDNLLCVNIGTLAQLGTSSSAIAGGITFNNVNGYVNNGGYGLFDLRYGAGLFLNKIGMFVGGVASPVHPASMTTVAGTTVLKGLTGFWDTVQASNCIFERFDQFVGITSASGMVYQNFFFSNVVTDYTRRHCVYLESQSGGVISTVRFDASCWMSSWETDCVAILGAGYNDNHAFKATITIAGVRGVYYSNTTARNNVFEGMAINSCNRLGTAAGALEFAGSSTGFSVIGCKGNIDTTAVGMPWRAGYGIQIAADCDRYVVSGCAFEGSTSGYNLIANTTASSNRRIFNNINANYAGHKTQTIPATGVRYTNTTACVEEWSFFGGTITGGYDKNNWGFPGALGYVHFRLQPNDSFSVGYSVAPTIHVFVEP